MNTKSIDEPTQAAIDALKDYIYFIEEMGSWAGLTFKEQSYCKFAAKKLVRLLRQSREPPLIVLENFAERMKNASKNNFDNNVFFTSMQVADHIIMSLTT